MKTYFEADSLDFLKILGRMIADMFGRDCEVVISDLDHPKQQVIAIYNGHVTGREVGQSNSHAITERIRVSEHGHSFNYRKNKVRMAQSIKSSTILVKVKGRTYAFCINYDCTDFESLSFYLKNFLQMNQDDYDLEPSTLQGHSQLDAIIEQELLRRNKQVFELSSRERREIVNQLNDKGIFRLQKGVSLVAERLGVSRYTIYNYLNHEKEE